MDAKEVKTFLKQAREAIKEKDYKAALKYCKAVLKADKNNYNAWVFVGAAAQEIDQPDQSEAAFKRAIEISPDQLLAWQGLCNFYEKQEKKNELILVFKKLIALNDGDKEKKLEIYEKLISLVQSLKDKGKLIRVLKSKLEVVKGNSVEEYLVQKQIFQELCGEVNLTDCDRQLQTEALETLISHETFSEDYCKRIFSTCIECLLKNGDEDYCLSLALQIYKKHPESASCLEFLCRMAMNMYLDNRTIMNSLEELSERLSKCDSSKGLPIIFQGFVFFISKNYVAAVKKLTEGLDLLEYCIQGWYFLSKSQLLLHRYSDSIKSSKAAIDVAVKSKAPLNIIGKFYLLLGQALHGKQNWDAAVKALEKSVEYLGQTKEILTTFCLTLLSIEQLEKAEKMLQDLKGQYGDDADVLQLEGYAHLLRSDYSNALQKLRHSVSLLESAFTLHLIGIVLWKIEQSDKAFKVLSKAVELDPYFAKNFLYLGHLYQNHLYDKSKACLCYQKAFNLDSTDFETGMALSQLLKDFGKEEENIKVLKIITEQASLGSCKWAWTQLGLYQLKNSSCTDAIFSLQKALRADPNSSYGWECLADAYLKRGSYESALKAFERAAEINPKSMYPLYQRATIQKMRGFFIEAVEKYKDLLDIAPTYIPALIGMGETYVLLAKKSFGDCLYGLARDYCQEALQTLARVASLNTKLSCLWKLAGDACIIPFHFDIVWFPMSVPSELLQSSETSAVSCCKVEILAFSSKFFGRAITIKENVSSLWHDLGVSYHYQSIVLDNRDDKLSFAKKAFICFQKAISISPNFEAHWTALGVVALGKELEDSSFGQHALIKSLQINKNNAETWTNLGVLYLENENKELSNAAFKKAQSSEPTYPLSWVGQAIIADQVKHSETMDLYRHATTLGSHTEALLGYSRVVCEALLDVSNKNSESYKYNIEQMNAVVTAVDCAVKFTANKNDSAEAFNVLGMLSERQGIQSVALKSYKQALDLLEIRNRTEVIEIVRANYARSLSVVGLVNEAIKEFLLLKKIDMSILCSFAFAFYKAKQYEQALKLFKQAFDKSKSPSEKSHIKVAMAMVARNLQGPNIPNPLTLLYESSQILPASVPGLLALCASGILDSDQALALAAQKELNSYKYHKEYCSSVAFLWATQVYQQNGAQAGRSELLKFVHSIPNNGTMWLQMASCLLQWNKEYANMAATCTKIGSFHEGCKEQAAQIFALCQMSIGYRKGALAAAQKAVHVNPAKLSNWVTLAAACHVAEKDRKYTGWMFSFVKKLAKEQGIKSDLLGALIILEAFHYISCENMSDAKVLLSKALSVSSFNSETQSALQILDAVVKVFINNGNLEPLVIALKNNPKSFLGWHILSQLMLSSGKFYEAEKTISRFAVTAEKIFPKWAAFPLLQLAVLAYKAMHANNEERDKWMQLGEEITGKAVHILPNSQAARFMQGIFAVESGNTNLARRSFEKVLSNPTIKEEKWMEKAAEYIIETKNLKRKGGKEQETS